MQTSTHSKQASSQRVAASSNGDFLLFLGKRVRELRNRRGLTRKMMAKEADVSERHLAQLEAGEGNVSIVLLRRMTPDRGATSSIAVPADNSIAGIT